jgi:hypothetical protein
VEASNGWVPDERDSVFNAYRFQPSDSTVERKFVLWVRSRDGAQVADLTPDFLEIIVIDPKFERDILLVDFTQTFFKANYIPRNDIKDYFDTLITRWDGSVDFDPSGFFNDYVPISVFNDVPLKRALQHKVIIMYNDEIRPAGLATPGASIATAADAGVNVWGTMRCPVSGWVDNPNFDLAPAPVLREYFGIQSLVFSGWVFNVTNPPFVRIEDFMGTHTLDQANWPELAIDSQQLHERYVWGNPSGGAFLPLITWVDSLPYLPEVNWCSRFSGPGSGTTPIYLYKSAYPAGHFRGPDYTFEGSPVGILKETDLYRTVFFAFTPPGIRDAEMQVVANRVFDWLFEPWLTQPITSSGRASSGMVTTSSADPMARERYWRRYSEGMHPDGYRYDIKTREFVPR